MINIVRSPFSLLIIWRLSGLGVWFLLWVQEVPGSNPGWAHFLIERVFWKKCQKKLGPTRIWTKDLSDCSRLLYHWAIDPISIQMYNFTRRWKRWEYNLLKKLCQKWDLNPRPHTRTRNLIEALYQRARGHLESGALDHSAILTLWKYFWFSVQTSYSIYKKERKINIPSGGRTQDLWIRSPTRYPLR